MRENLNRMSTRIEKLTLKFQLEHQVLRDTMFEKEKGWGGGWGTDGSF